MSKSLISLAVTAFILGGCSLIPEYKQPQAPVAAQYPQGPAYSPAEAAKMAAAEQGWREFFRDLALQRLIQTALVNNRDLRVAALNIDAYRAQYRISVRTCCLQFPPMAAAAVSAFRVTRRRPASRPSPAAIQRLWASAPMTWTCSVVSAASASKRWKPTSPAKRHVAAPRSVWWPTLPMPT